MENSYDDDDNYYSRPQRSDNRGKTAIICIVIILIIILIIYMIWIGYNNNTNVNCGINNNGKKIILANQIKNKYYTPASTFISAPNCGGTQMGKCTIMGQHCGLNPGTSDATKTYSCQN